MRCTCARCENLKGCFFIRGTLYVFHAQMKLPLEAENVSSTVSLVVQFQGQQVQSVITSYVRRPLPSKDPLAVFKAQSCISIFREIPRCTGIRYRAGLAVRHYIFVHERTLKGTYYHCGSGVAKKIVYPQNESRLGQFRDEVSLYMRTRTRGISRDGYTSSSSSSYSLRSVEGSYKLRPSR